MKRFLLYSLLLSLSSLCQAQTDSSKNSLIPGKISFSAYMDLYYSINLNDGRNELRPYAVSNNNMNIFTINLAYLQINYESDRIRSRITPALGTYMNANYAQAPGGFKFLLEANAGYRLSRKKQFWLDAGIFGSPYTNENAIAKDHIPYTRSLSAEQSPYYLSGVKLSYPFTEKLTLTLFLINGWQEISDPNSRKALGSQLTYKRNKWLANWSTYAGNEKANLTPDFRYRFFNDFNIVMKPGKKVKLVGDGYVGSQHKVDSTGDQLTHWWWQANLSAWYKFGKVISFSGRAEYFSDPHTVIVLPVTSAKSFHTFGSSLGINLEVQSNVMFRFEVRTFRSKENLFLLNGQEKNYYNMFTSNMTLWY